METIFTILIIFLLFYIVLKFLDKLFKKPTERKRSNQTYFLNNKITPEAKTLYAELIKLEIPAILERFDGYKTIDISIPEARLDIEVDGTHHNTNHKQALADLKRTYYSLANGYYTLRIPNSLVNNNLIETINFITKILDVRLEAIQKENLNVFDYSEMFESTEPYQN